MDIIKYLLASINESKVVAGIAIVSLNLLTKHVEMGIRDSQAMAIRLGAMREMLIFAMVFVATRDVVISVIVAATFTLFTAYLFNEESSLCIVPDRMRHLRDMATREKLRTSMTDGQAGPAKWESGPV